MSKRHSLSVGERRTPSGVRSVCWSAVSVSDTTGACCHRRGVVVVSRMLAQDPLWGNLPSRHCRFNSTGSVVDVNTASSNQLYLNMGYVLRGGRRALWCIFVSYNFSVSDIRLNASLDHTARLIRHSQLHHHWDMPHKPPLRKLRNQP